MKSWIIPLHFFVMLQTQLPRWTDESPYVYKNWAYPSSDNKWPTMRQHCMTLSNTMILPHHCINLNDSGVANLTRILSSRLQPFANNNTWMCTAASFHGLISKWITIPCEKNLNAVLVVCETRQEIVIKRIQNLTSNSSSNSENDFMYSPARFYTYLPDYTYPVYIDRSGNIDKIIPRQFYSYSFYPDYELISSVEIQKSHRRHLTTILPPSIEHCKRDMIYILGVCFKLHLAIDNYKFLSQCYLGSNWMSRTTPLLTLYLQQWITFDDIIYVVASYSGDVLLCNMLKLGGEDYETRVKLVEIGRGVPCINQTSFHLCASHPVPYVERCTPGTYRCQDQTCISADYICDGHNDCVYGEDETNCASCNQHGDICHSNCSEPECICGDGYLQCQSGGCVSYSLVMYHTQVQFAYFEFGLREHTGTVNRKHQYFLFDLLINI